MGALHTVIREAMAIAVALRNLDGASAKNAGKEGGGEKSLELHVYDWI